MSGGNEEIDLDKLGAQVWRGPKIVKYGNKNLAIYDYQFAQGEEHDPSTQRAFEEISLNLKQNEFRRLTLGGKGNNYQFIRSFSPSELRSLDSGLKYTTLKIYQFALDRMSQKILQVTTQQNKTRSEREKSWKEWYSNLCHQQQEFESRKIDFFQQKIEPIELRFSSKLLEFQINHVKNLLYCLKEKGVAIDASDTGTGKTYSALCLAKELGLMPIVVCPKSIIPGWAVACQHFGINEYYINTYGKFRNGSISYCRKIGKTTDQILETYPHQLVPKIEFEWELRADQHLLIFDECHKVKNPNTLNYAIFWWARQANRGRQLKVLSLSATMADKIKLAFSVCYMLGLVQDLKEFNQKYQPRLGEQQGLNRDFGFELSPSGFYRFNPYYQPIKDKLENQDLNLVRLHRDLFPFNGSRMIIEDLGEAFPENLVMAQTYDMAENTKEIRQTYDQADYLMAKGFTQRIAKKKEMLRGLEDQLSSLMEKDQMCAKDESKELVYKVDRLRKDIRDSAEKLQEAEIRINSYLAKGGHQIVEDNILKMITSSRMRIEKLKSETIVELAEDFYQQGKSVVIFVNFLETLRRLNAEIRRVLKTDQISLLHGLMGLSERDRNIQSFQQNRNRVMIVTMGTGSQSISLHDVEGGHPRVSLISPSWSGQDLLQALGRIYRAEGKSKCLQYLVYCAGTIEERIAEVINQKLRTIRAINDGDLSGGIIV